ncbi:lantibiotic immunity ABC transporter MutE/EpiE family permease subunit [Paenibacillus faecis]|uniref:Lantibiotic immunity ABC transporter MutE/EpiE family permease subunit n=1 Tax=Paenibacillus faecis TaxID=862114 RepID=A0A5D0CLB8_9BACL|nr:lantibiotic immunity ABC transporter MutE/EpiE family permease subunit [Paenibacillus faecis]TYA10165.1 lantibiotic immunity ABC transporter MutE/EpiE family permease subunit [Paenibacillus faecis]
MHHFTAVVRAEHLKVKRTFTRKLVYIAPLVTLMLCVVLMGGHFFQSGSFNWWYAMMLPGTLALLCIGVLQKDARKLRYRSILALPLSPSLTWLGKIVEVSRLFLMSSLFLWLILTAGSMVFPGTLSAITSLIACLVIFVTFLWQIPLWLYLVDRIGVFVTFILSMVGNVGLGIMLATSDMWWLVPFTIPARLMCPIIQVLPNGLPVPEGDPLMDGSVILPGLLISVGLFVLLSFITAKAFDAKETR